MGWQDNGSVQGAREYAEALEMHEELCELPLKSGKLVYVDKTFATDRAATERIFAHARANNTKYYSSSGFRFSSELKAIDKKSIYKIYSEEPGTYEIYSIHQIEPIVCLMESPPSGDVHGGERTSVHNYQV